MPHRGEGPKFRHNPELSIKRISLSNNRFSPIGFRESRHNQYGKYPLPPKLVKESSGELPVMAFKSQILRAVDISDVVIIQAETGAGKSTMIPQFLAEAGYVVNATQPRRMAAESLANFVAQQQGTEVGEMVGFQHGLRQKFNPNNTITFLTDAYRLAQELGGATSSVDKQVLILDEAHEKNVYMEVLIALHKFKSDVLGEPVPKLVIMSATINPNNLIKFLGGNVPIIKIPGRTFPIKKRQPTESIFTDIEAAVRKKENTLVFLPGKPEITEIRSKSEASLIKNNLPAIVMPLHSGLSSAHQQRCLDRYDIPKVIDATNVAEASITIPDIDFVVMSGLVKRITINEGIECLTLMPFSRFNFEQQKGRVGRTKPGFYTYRGDVPIKNLSHEPPADIQNSKVDGLILRLLCSKYFSTRDSIERLELLNPIPKKHLDQAFKSLEQLNLVGPKGHVTTEGQLVASLPVSVAVGKLLVTANKKSLAWSEENIMRYAIDVAAVLTNGAIGKRECKSQWLSYCEEEKDSDALAQALLLRHALFLPDDQLVEHGFDSVAASRSKDLRDVLLKRFRMSDEVNYEIDALVRGEVLESVWTAMSSVVFQQKTTHLGPRFRPLDHPNNHSRRLDSTSIIELDSDSSCYIVGHPFDILSNSDSEHTEIDRLVHMATKINMKWLAKNCNDKTLKTTASSLSKRKSKPEGKPYRNKPRGRGRFPA